MDRARRLVLMTRVCLGCSVIQTDENSSKLKKTGRFSTYCRSCNRQNCRNWHLKNPEKQNLYDQRNRQFFRSLLDSIKSERPCYDCGNIFLPECMDFDHVRGTKFFDVSLGNAHCWEEVRKEIDKCQLVCACCHRTRTKLRRIPQPSNTVN